MLETTQKLILPLVESLIASNRNISLSNIKIIGVQHILETTHSMFQSLFKLGLKPENVSLLGKCYSTSAEVYEEMLADGIDVSPKSFHYSAHLQYDELFSTEVHTFLSSRLNDINSGSFDCIIVLDDGGKCISFFNQNFKQSTPVIAIEQTSSGYNTIRSQTLKFPVINVARSPVKLTLESPMIAEAAAERLYSSLNKKHIQVSKALIIGGGAIGQALKKRLGNEIQADIYDQDTDLNEFETTDLSKLIANYPLIIGCTGTNSIPQALHSYLSPGTILVSVSSSDREFDAYHLRKTLPNSSNWHTDLLINDILLINSGFPVNFDGERENIEPELIQLTIALITGAILQACQHKSYLPCGIIPLENQIEERIKTEFLDSKRLSI